jgi:hypothetical protein
MAVWRKLMKNNQLVAAFVLVGVAALAGVAGCGGSRNSGSDDPPDFSLGAGDVNKEWSSSSAELIHDLSRGALYYLDVENGDVVAIDVASGDDSGLVDALSFEPSMLRLSADAQDLYILESAESAADTDGFADLVRYDIAGDFVDTDLIELDDDKIVTDFVVTNNNRVIVASYEPPTIGVTPSVQWLSLHSGDNGALLDALELAGVQQQLTLNRDQQTFFDQIMIGNGYRLLTVSASGDAINVSSEGNASLGEGANNTYEPDGERIFRSNGTVWGEDEEVDLGTSYVSIDFDLVADRVVILVEGSNGFLIRYFDLDSLELQSEQSLPTIADATGMEPVKLFVDDGELYVVYRQLTSAASKNYLLVEFDYPR